MHEREVETGKAAAMVLSCVMVKASSCRARGALVKMPSEGNKCVFQE